MPTSYFQPITDPVYTVRRFMSGTTELIGTIAAQMPKNEYSTNFLTNISEYLEQFRRGRLVANVGRAASIEVLNAGATEFLKKRGRYTDRGLITELEKTFQRLPASLVTGLGEAGLFHLRNRNYGVGWTVPHLQPSLEQETRRVYGHFGFGQVHGASTQRALLIAQTDRYAVAEAWAETLQDNTPANYQVTLGPPEVVTVEAQRD